MKKLLALLLVLLLALPSGFALSEGEPETGASQDGLGGTLGNWWNALQEKAGEAADTVADKAQEVIQELPDKAQEAMNALTEKADQVWQSLPENVQETIQSIPEKAEETAKDVQEKLEEAKENASNIISLGKFMVPVIWQGVKDTAAEKAGEAVKNVQEKLGEAKENASNIISLGKFMVPVIWQGVKDTVAEKAGEAVKNVQEKLGEAKEKASGVIGRVKEALPGICESGKAALAEKVESGKQFIGEMAGQIADWLNGKDPEGEPEINPEDKPEAEKPEPRPEDASSPEPLSRMYYMDVFYMGMPVSEAKALGLGDPTVDEENGVQYWGVAYDEPQGFAFVLFSGLDDSAKLTEIVYVLYSDADTVTELEQGIDIQTTEETVNAIYDEIESWFTDMQALELGDHLALPLYSGFSEEEETISRAVLYLYEDGEGYDAATHYVSTTDCGVNLLQILYLDAVQAEALLAK